MAVSWGVFALYDPASYIESVAPTLTSASPTDNSSAVAVGSDIVLNFSENVAIGSGNVVISNGNGDTRTISITDAGQVTLNMAQVTIGRPACKQQLQRADGRSRHQGPGG